MTVEVYQNNVKTFEHELHRVSVSNGFMNSMMTGGFVNIPFSANDLCNVSIYDEGQKTMEILSTFEDYQFSMGTYTEGGSTLTGVTNNSLIFKVLKVLDI